MKVRFSDDHGAGFAQLAHLKCVASGHRSFERQRSCRRRQVDRFEVVLHHDRNTVERAPGSSSGPFTIERVRVVERVRVERNHRVDRRPILVVSGDAGEVRLGDRPRGRCSVTHRAREISNRLFGDVVGGTRTG